MLKLTFLGTVLAIEHGKLSEDSHLTLRVSYEVMDNKMGTDMSSL